jgi:hypothetical protein
MLVLSQECPALLIPHGEAFGCHLGSDPAGKRLRRRPAAGRLELRASPPGPNQDGTTRSVVPRGTGRRPPVRLLSRDYGCSGLCLRPDSTISCILYYYAVISCFFDTICCFLATPLPPARTFHREDAKAQRFKCNEPDCLRVRVFASSCLCVEVPLVAAMPRRVFRGF